METKFKVGDKVIVRKGLVLYESYAMENSRKKQMFIFDMCQFEGMEVTILNAYDYGYIIEGNECFWTDEMFEPSVKKVTSETRLIQETEKMDIFVDRIIYNEPATIMFYRTAHLDSYGRFISWSPERKIVAKCNVDSGDVYDKQIGYQVCLLKAISKEANKVLAKM
ncbi:hypothetical protein SUNDANCE_141 [Brevibacillus phage Sundance]|uniref:hypothetical protein n=1 Tax=Brevibacillus phage Sundance TaxID=1691958 RepID=UPI0006BC91D1|nr:hypothetical protein AVT09_gp141 [Brevibacillus phage Sundance]ALA47957.1 hypothetical protein SUNDANCE_141 [Brevibacillus phage Sundance]